MVPVVTCKYLKTHIRYLSVAARVLNYTLVCYTLLPFPPENKLPPLFDHQVLAQEFCLINKPPFSTVHVHVHTQVCIYYCMSGRAIWGNIQLEGGSIGPTKGRYNTEPES